MQSSGNAAFARIVAQQRHVAASCGRRHRTSRTMDADNAWVSREDDDETERVYHVCVECPRKDKCSAQSWSRAKCWSYNDEETCKEKVAHHLMTSSLHYLSKEDAESVALEGIYEVRVETPAEREQYRVGIEEQHRRDEERNANLANEPKGKGKSKNKRKDVDLHEEVKRLRREVDRTRDPRSSSSSWEAPSHGCVAGPIHRDDTMCVIPTARGAHGITSAKVEMIIDSLERSKIAAQSLQKIAHNSAKSMQERATAAMDTSTQMADEVQVLAAGKALLMEFLVKFQAASGT